MNTSDKTKSKYGLLSLFALAFCIASFFSCSKYPNKSVFGSPLTGDKGRNEKTKADSVRSQSGADSALLQKDTVPGNRNAADSLLRKSDSTRPASDTFHVKLSNDSLDAAVEYAATDSMVLDVPTKKIILFNKSSTKYKDLDLQAYKIELDQPSQIVVATFSRDSAGAQIGKPHFVQGESNMDADSIVYNFKTQKGITKHTFTQQGEMFVYGEKIKKVSVSDFYALHGRFTTCNLDTPHFAFRTNKMKLVNQKLAISGPVHPEFEGVPVPVYLPFGFFPLSQGRHSGILPPQFTANQQFGLGLEGLGYYKVLNEMFDMMVRGDIYSYGGWRAVLTPTYRKRYRYSGRLNLSFQRTRYLSSSPLSGKDYETAQTWNIQWSHSADTKARPGTSFQASVNAGSTQFNRYVGVNPTINFNNQLYSSIAYSKNWNNKYILNLNAGHNQNSNTRLMQVRLPDGSFTANTVYPFQPKNFVGEAKWYEKLGIGLNTVFQNQVSFYDSAFSFAQLMDTIQWGVQHSIPITLALPSLGPVQVSPGLSFTERWYGTQSYLTWNDVRSKVDTAHFKGFYTARDISFSIGLNTALFGTFDRFGKNSALRAIRHVIRPSISANYKPNLNGKDWYKVKVDTSGRQQDFSKYTGTLYGAFSQGEFGGLSFTFDNNLEMKLRSKTDTTDGGIKKVKLIDGFGFTGSYNFLADTMKLSPISLYLRSTLFQKVNLTASATMDPYKRDKQGYRTKYYAWQGGNFNLGNVTSGNISLSTSFTSKKSEEKKRRADSTLQNSQLPVTLEEQQAQMNYIRANPAEFADFDIPWSINISYSLSFSRIQKRDYSGYYTTLSSNINLSGDFNLTPKWKVGANTFYNFNGGSISQLTMFLSRELHCWQLGINITPVGLYRSFNITINPKSGILRDLRINRSRYFYNQ